MGNPKKHKFHTPECMAIPKRLVSIWDLEQRNFGWRLSEKCKRQNFPAPESMSIPRGGAPFWDARAVTQSLPLKYLLLFSTLIFRCGKLKGLGRVFGFAKQQ